MHSSQYSLSSREFEYVDKKFKKNDCLLKSDFLKNLHIVVVKGLISIFLLCSMGISAQNTLSKEEAIKMALEFNYGVKMAEKDVKVANNNASFLNSGFLPSIVLDGNANYSKEDGETKTGTGQVFEQEGAENTSYGGTVGMNFLLFDGLGRLYNYKKLRENYRLSKLEARIVIENMVLQLVTQYYQVAEISSQTEILAETLEVSEKRFKRAELGYDFGQNTKLEFLNAKVDYSKDLVELKKIQTNLKNTKRSFNLSLGNPINSPFEVETEVDFATEFDMEIIKNQALLKNADIEKANKNIKISKLDVNIVKKNFLPSLSINASYGVNGSIAEQGFIESSYSIGPRVGVTLNWNLFDGGSSIIQSRNALIARDKLKIQKEQVQKQIETEVENAYENYVNSLAIVELEQASLETNELNFQRSETAFKLGQSTSIQYREAQLNLMNARLNLNKARFAAKIAELEILKLSGELLDRDF